MYKIPNKGRLSIERYDQIVTTLSNTNCDIIIGSDQNLDYLKVSTDNKSYLFDVFSQFTAGILPTLKLPTQIEINTRVRQSLMTDHIYVKCNMDTATSTSESYK